MIKACAVVKGVIPILDYNIEGGWYTMPVADKITNHIVMIGNAVPGILGNEEKLIRKIKNLM